MHVIDLVNYLEDAATGADQKVVCVIPEYDELEIQDVVVCPKTGNIHIVLK